MESREAYSLRVCKPMLTQDLDVLEVVDGLFAQSYLAETECNDIQRICSLSRRDAARKLLEILRGRPVAFGCFLSLLKSIQPHLAIELEAQHNEAPVSRRREQSLSDLRDILIDGAVPDEPPHHITRRELLDDLATSLRTLSKRLRIGVSDDVSRSLTDLSLSEFSSADINIAHGSVPSFKTSDDIKDDLQPPPTSAWLLVHGPFGCGKTVLSSSVLRRNTDLLATHFPGGVVWLSVGPLSSPSNESRHVDDQRALLTRLVPIIDRLERKVSILNRASSNGNRWLDYGSPPTSKSPPISAHGSPSPDMLYESLDRLRGALMRRQIRPSWTTGDTEQAIPSSLLLIVLDDVWDSQLGRYLSDMPAAFLVTSRDQDVLHQVGTSVDHFALHPALSDEEAAFLFAKWTNQPVKYFLPSDLDTSTAISSPKAEKDELNWPSLIQLCRGVPFSLTLFGNLLRENIHRLSDYLSDPTGSGYLHVNWKSISRQSAYPYSSVFDAVHQSLEYLSPKARSLYHSLVIFDASVTLTSSVTGIYWSKTEEAACLILAELFRFSLIHRRWVNRSNCYGYMMHPLQCDLLRVCVSPVKQATYHAQFVHNYEKHCSGRWTRLVISGDHGYFWQNAVEHVYKSGRLDRLVELMTNLEFLRARLAVFGTSPVIADFNQYRAVFLMLDRMDDWHSYLRFIQTNAYFVINPISVQMPTRNRSPDRAKHTRVGLCRSLESIPTALQADSVADLKPSTYRPPTASNAPLGPKGLDLIQLGLGLPQNSPVFQQAVKLLLRQYEVAAGKMTKQTTPVKQSPLPQLGHRSIALNPRVSEYYWFWCNSHVAASQLVWAILTGPQAITCLATETHSDILANPSLQVPSPPSNGCHGEEANRSNVIPRYRRRFLAATQDGRVLLLDATSGYEVAVQQTYPPDTEVKFLSFLSNCTECLTCDSSGSLVVSTLPSPELLDRVHHPDCHQPDDDLHDCADSDDQSDDLQSPANGHGNLMSGQDVDDDGDDLHDEGVFASTSTSASIPPPMSEHRDSTHSQSTLPGLRSSLVTDSGDAWGNGTTSLEGDVHSKAWNGKTGFVRGGVVSPQLKVRQPTVLAEIPRLTEVVRMDGNDVVADGQEPNSCALHCIAAPPNLDVLVMGGLGCMNLKILQTDSGSDRTAPTIRHSAPCIYYLKREDKQLYMDCSRQLQLPPLAPDSPMVRLWKASLSAVTAVQAAVSDEAQHIAVAFSDGHVWVYSLEQIAWVTCISTHCATSMCETEKTTASVNGTSQVWSIPSEPLDDASELASPEAIQRHSKPTLCFTSCSAADILCLDACLLFGQRVLAGGTTNGRVLFWRIRDGAQLFELSAHPTWITSIRLLPPYPAFPDSSGGTQSWLWNSNLSNLPIGLLTASADGVIKRWEVGAPCLPSPTTPLSADSSGLFPGPGAPLTPLPAGPFEREAQSGATALHGLWTDVFSVWFGSHGILMVVGRRRHSAELQFLFRPRQHTAAGEAVRDGAFIFNEVSLKPSQPIYWRPSKRHTVIAQPATSFPFHKTSDEATRMTESGLRSETTSPTGIAGGSPQRNPMRPQLALARHWIVTAGQPGTIHGKATAVAFWTCGHWVAVGFNTGLVQIYSLHFDEVRLYGIVKRFSLLERLPTPDGDSKRASQARSMDRVVHLHTWQSPIPNHPARAITLVVVAVFSSGAVSFWNVPSTTHDLAQFGGSCIDVAPSSFWPPMHNPGTLKTTHTPDSSCTINMQPRTLFDNDLTGLDVPVTWSTLRRIPYAAAPSTASVDDMKDPLRPSPPPDAPVRHVLAWLTAGRDGSVYGRQVVLPIRENGASNWGVDEEGIARPSRQFPPWRLDLDAHPQSVITDADVDPTGRWLVTASTDKTARVWSLSSGTLVFDTDKHPACVRTACFRPVIDGPLDSADAAAWYLATGDDAGVLRIWRLTPHILQDRNVDSEMKKKFFARAVSPDTYSVTRHEQARHAEQTLEAQRLLLFRTDHDSTFTRRFRSPDSIGTGQHRSSSSNGPSITPRSAPLFHSTAAGSGGTWLRRLVWSPDGRILSGLSDRLCVWPFESVDLPVNPSNSSPQHPAMSRLQARRGSAPTNQHKRTTTPQPVLSRCRVLRVFSSGVSNAINSPLNLLKVSPRRCCQPIVNGGCTSSQLPASLTDLPPTLVTVDANTGTLYVFDPIGALFCSEL